MSDVQDQEPRQPSARSTGSSLARARNWFARLRSYLSRVDWSRARDLVDRFKTHLRTSERAPITIAALAGIGLVGATLLVVLIVRQRPEPVPPAPVPTAAAQAVIPAAPTRTPVVAIATTRPNGSSLAGRCVPAKTQVRPGECATLALDRAALTAFGGRVAAVYILHANSGRRERIAITDRTEVCPEQTTHYAWDIYLRDEPGRASRKVAWCETTVEVRTASARP